MYHNGQDCTRSKLHTVCFHQTISTNDANKNSTHNDSLSIYNSTIIIQTLYTKQEHPYPPSLKEKGEQRLCLLTLT